MYNQALGCKTTGCFVGAIIVLGFFAYLLQSAQEMADQFKATRATPARQSQRGTQTGPGLDSGADDEAAADIINATRLPALLDGIRRYAADHQGILPPMETPGALQAALVPRYVSGKGIFESAIPGQPYLTNPALSEKPLKSFAYPAETMALYEPLVSMGSAAQKRRTVLFLDGHQSQVTPSEWDVLRGASAMPETPTNP